MNGIAQRQNEQQALQYLAAMRQLYKEDKRRTTLWFAVSLIMALAANGGAGDLRLV
ncbi:MAG: hypothetical protein GY759_03530 [Chloroflexi bacterium]|nr:hypothetical protein [Chloroflexota bacterium]